MALSASPRKVVPLASGDEWRPLKTNSEPNVTKRVFFCGVVVEGSENGRRLPEDVQDFIVSLGDPLDSSSENGLLTSNPESSIHERREDIPQRKRAMTDTSALADVIKELVSTERSYVKRLRTLKYDYADPLRKFSRSKDTSILPAYEAKTLFGNIDNLLPVNEAFLTDLERMISPTGTSAVGGIGDVALRHFKDLRGFEHYKQYYIKREEAQAIFEREMMRKSSGFAAFVDRIKYSSSDTKNRVGLRELLINPVQRVPQYTLLFRTMMKHMAPDDPQRIKLVEAEDAASRIALAETDEQTKRAAIMYCLSASVDDFPPGLISNSRRFIDCIDVEDNLADASGTSSGASAGSSSGSTLHCTLFLFDDKLMIVKRPGNGEKGGRTLAGLDELDKLTKAGGLPLGMKKSGMSCKGVVDVTDVVATDVGSADIHIYLENPPQDQTDRWSGRPFRSFSVVIPPAPVNLDPTRTEAEKKRFLENLWNVQATFRTKAGQSVVLCAEEREVESRGGRVTHARTYFNVYQRTAFLKEPKKTKVVVHVDPSGSADPIPFGMGGPPFVVIRVQLLAGDLSRYNVTSSDPIDEGEEDIVQTGRVPPRIIQTIHQFGLFKFRTGRNSLPSTPGASTRSRTAIFGLDAISRNLFNARPGSAMGDFFGGSVNVHRRSKSTISGTSIYTQTTSTGDGSLTRFSHRSNSTATAATTISTMDEGSLNANKPSRSRKLLKRAKSPARSDTESDWRSPSRASRSGRNTPSRSRSESRERGLDYSDNEDSNDASRRKMDPSELDLTMRLELARRNSNQQGKKLPPISYEKPVEETIYEEDPPLPVRPESRASRDSNSNHSTTTTLRAESPTRNTRSSSQHSSERRPMGPRCPSPLPPKSPFMRPANVELPSMDVDLALETTLVNITQSSAIPSRDTHTPAQLPRSKRQPFLPTTNTDNTPKTVNGNSGAGVQPLSIKKKTSVRSPAVGTPTPVRRAHVRNSPLSRTGTRTTPPGRVSPQARSARTLGGGFLRSSAKGDVIERMTQGLQSGRDMVESSRRAIKRIKLEIDDFRSSAPSPDKGTRTPLKGAGHTTREKLERMDEMRQLIGMRQGEFTPRSRPRSMVVAPSELSSHVTGAEQFEGFAQTVETIVSEADDYLARAVTAHESLQDDLRQLVIDFKERLVEMEKTRVELQNTKRQCELVKSLLADATAEKEIMYEAFNEELDGMYHDANLPDDEAWTALSTDLRRTKEARNALSKENSHLKRRLAEMESQNEEWGASLLK